MLALACLLSCALAVPPAVARAVTQEREFATGPLPAWVERTGLEPVEVPTDELRGGTYSVLVDKQDRFVDGEFSSFAERAWYVHNAQGVQNGSQIAIDFDPSYQELTIHAIEVIRDGQTLDRLVAENIEVLQREEELDARIYDGTKTALVFVEDVRPGDIVRHSYTLRGANPAFAGHYMRNITLAGRAPMRRIRHRLLWRSERPLTILPHGTTLAPTINEHDGVREYIWDLRDVPAVELLEPEPVWYFATPWIQFTSFRDWNEIARWESELLDPVCEPGAELAAEIEAIRLAEEQPFERALAAVRFVQDEIRYLGIELGAGAYAASQPETVYARRFGDCKDKSLLLVTMLRELEIESRVGLVSWTFRRTIPDYAPSSALFDHVIVRIDLPGGPYWVDPTEAMIGGDLRSYEPPPFGQALVVDDSTLGPEAITNAGRPGITRITHRFEARELGGPAQLEVITDYEGRPANDFRESFGWTTGKEYTQNCLEYYRAFYETAESEMEVQVQDDLAANVITTTERYSFDDFWSDYDGDLWGEFYAMEIDYLLPVLSAGAHEHPIRIAHPVHYEQSIVVQLDDSWWFEPESEVLENAGFRFTFDADFDDDANILRLDYTYRSRADHLQPGEVDAFIADVDRAEELVRYDIAGDESMEFFAIVAACFLIAFLAFVLLVGGVGVRSHLVRKGRTFEQTVADLAHKSPWFTMWTRPRATMRAILPTRRAESVLGLAAAAGILDSLGKASFRGLGDHVPLPAIFAIALVGGAIGGIVSMYLAGWVLGWVGRLLGGRGRAPQVRAAFAWSSIVSIWLGLTWIPALLLFGGEMFTTETPRIDASIWLESTLYTLGAFELLMAAWAIVVFLKCLAEAHSFSTWKALATVLIPGVVLVTLGGILGAVLFLLTR